MTNNEKFDEIMNTLDEIAYMFHITENTSGKIKANEVKDFVKREFEEKEHELRFNEFMQGKKIFPHANFEPIFTGESYQDDVEQEPLSPIQTPMFNYKKNE